MHGYPKIFTLGHKWIQEILDGPVVVQEKVDGSQFSFEVTSSGEVKCKSREILMDVACPHKLFSGAVNTVLALSKELHPGWVYRGECVNSPRHNVLHYSRTPKGNVILFDVERADCDFLAPFELIDEAHRLGLECVPTFYTGEIKSLEHFQQFLTIESVLGGVIVEGVVIKNYNKLTNDKKIMMGKIVREDFKEEHRKVWKAPQDGAIESIIKCFQTEARWQKAVQHLKDRGELEETPRDIGKLIPEVMQDIKEECKDQIKDMLYAAYSKQIVSGATKGLPEWYKKQIMVDVFNEGGKDARI